MKVGRAVIERLAENGIDTLFGIPGKQTLPLNEAIGNRDDIDFVVARHETAVSHAAWGYAETSGRPAATVVIPGPGDMNAMNGLKNALNDCTPLVHIAVETSPEIRGGDGIHETPPDTYDNVVKTNTVVDSPESTLVELQQAIDTAMTPPKGPVRVGIPKNFLKQDVALATPATYSREYTTDVPAEDVAAGADLLASSSEPVILAGGGVRASGGSDRLRAVAEALNAPIVTTYKGKGAVPDSDDRVAGALSGSASPELLDCLAEADAMLAVGTDFDAVATRAWSVEVPEALVHVTLSPDDLGTGYDPTVGIVADATAALDALATELDDRTTPDGNGIERATAVRAGTADRIEPLLGEEPPLTSVQALRTVREAIPEETVVAADAGGFRVWGLNVFEAAGPRSYVNPGSWATMGTGLPSGLGAQLANPDDDVVVLTGDGGLMMCLHELHTAVSEEIPVTVLVFNNSDYAIISEEAGRSFDLPEEAYSWADAPLDFATIADGMGLETAQASRPDEIAAELTDALDTDAPTLLEVPTDPTEPQASTWMSSD
ncbi:acetolactate synthase, large subunit [Halovenus aranensis]|jgi:acetolactate synthase-1/2/3 large subunit|uniref:Acetolactate synthase, large subunit n=1 Tax=Halovenus aranensis TaxID=890420 RepID=A0A1G8RP92_9EURY|nr:thiamine pyrophosphate-binding protein [Halovenus aranensis]SDJ18894.1 acetolactate synthase, large subunit [Halovenus aranensis]